MTRFLALFFLLTTPGLADSPLPRNVCRDESPCNRFVHFGIGYVATEVAQRAGTPDWLACLGVPAAVTWVKEGWIDDNPGFEDGLAFFGGSLLNCGIDLWWDERRDGARLRFTGVLDTAGGPEEGMFLQYTVVRW